MVAGGVAVVCVFDVDDDDDDDGITAGGTFELVAVFGNE